MKLETDHDQGVIQNVAAKFGDIRVLDNERCRRSVTKQLIAHLIKSCKNLASVSKHNGLQSKESCNVGV